MSTSLSTNRHKDILLWKALALEYEMKIRYLERALAQEESKLRIAEQVRLIEYGREQMLYVLNVLYVSDSRVATVYAPCIE